MKKSGLLLPKGKGPFPLVIQIGRYVEGKFLPEGVAAAAYAAQPLVAQGMAVLQLDVESSPLFAASFKDKDGRPMRQEEAQWLIGQEITERLDAAVDVLSRRGLIDRKRIGVLGFSATGYMTYYVTTHARSVTPAAALVADSTLRTYGEYVAQEATFNGITLVDGLSPAAKDFTRFYGGTFWEEEGRARWLEHAPDFNVHRTQTPTLFVYNSSLGANVDYLTETVGAFRLNRREMDLMLIPRSDHQLAKPRQWEASLTATVEWMAFWLQGKEISPEKKDQYWHWNALKKQRDERWAKEGNPWDKPPRQNAAASSSATPVNSSEPSKVGEKPYIY